MQVRVKITEAERRALKRLALEQDVSLQDVVTGALRGYLEANGYDDGTALDAPSPERTPGA